MVPGISFLVAPNAFKGTLTSSEAADEIAKGVKREWPKSRCITLPLADGGEGTLKALARTGSHRWHTCRVRNPFGRPRVAKWLELPGKTAVIESAQAIGWRTTRVRNPLRASSWGVGGMMKQAMRSGMKRMVLGLGDTVTVDGGLGMIQALGEEGLKLKRLTVLCDVQVPLLGPKGAARFFGPQKGASPSQVRELERRMTRWADVLEWMGKRKVRRTPGSGAAGGLGAACAAIWGAKLISGADYILTALQIRQIIKRCDLVVTGEGRLDAQSLQGKASWKLARLASRNGVPCVYLTGFCALSSAKIPRGVHVVELGRGR